MKILLAFILGIFACAQLKAQDAMGKTRAEVREMIRGNSGIKLCPGTDRDTLNMQGGLTTMMYYKNDVCYASKSIMPLSYKDMLVEQLSKGSYKKLNDSTWLNPAGTVKVEITVEKDKDRFIVDTSQAQAY